MKQEAPHFNEGRSHAQRPEWLCGVVQKLFLAYVPLVRNDYADFAVKRPGLSASQITKANTKQTSAKH